MTRILKHTLAASPKIKEGTDSYIDDILVDTHKVKASEVVDHLEKFGLKSKPPEVVSESAVLELRISKNPANELMFSCGNSVPVVDGKMSRRELFSVCGKLVGHYPIAGWL